MLSFYTRLDIPNMVDMHDSIVIHYPPLAVRIYGEIETVYLKSASDWEVERNLKLLFDFDVTKTLILANGNISMTRRARN